MDCTAQRLNYRDTLAFSKLALDYLDNADALQPFYGFRPDKEGLLQQIKLRQSFTVNRPVLVAALQQQYADLPMSNAVKQHLEDLLEEQTFTITTAHQPNLFTGPLYFFYKILHVIKLAEELRKELPQYKFVPVYYMGSEDADVEELAHFHIRGEKREWKTEQSGAFGRFIIDQQLIEMINQLEGEIAVHSFGNEYISKLRSCYRKGNSIQQATFEFVNELLGHYGLIVLIPDVKELRQQMISVFEDELLHHRSAGLVTSTTEQLARHYKVQASGREINLFYLDEDLRERIEAEGDQFKVANTTIRFSKEEILKELSEHPERFSPNVILRGLYQETILPNIAFVGGGGELAYWMELKEVFQYYKVPYPVLLLRNSFLLLEEKWNTQIQKLGFTVEDFFQSKEQLLNKLVQTHTQHQLTLDEELKAAITFYEELSTKAASVDPTLEQHVVALREKAVYRLHELEKKIFRAEKRKFSDQKQQIEQVKNYIAPNGTLQERIENIAPFFAKWGTALIDELYKHSLTLEQQFVIITIH